jgi:hypothetical protein
MSRGKGGGRPRGVGKYELPAKSGTGLGPLQPTANGPQGKHKGMGASKAWCYRCDSEHRWEDECPAA